VIRIAGFEVPIGDWPMEFTSTLAKFMLEHDVDSVFVHSGAVSFQEGCILLPGRSGSGKTTLVMALLNRGARFMSDEYAVIGPTGVVTPFPRPLGVKATSGTDWIEPTGPHEDEPRPVVGIVLARYLPGGGDLREEPLGRGLMGLIDNALPIRSDPARCLPCLTAAAETARFVVAGDRGEAESLAAWLIDTFELTPY
jgi:hypothetical protein